MFTKKLFLSTLILICLSSWVSPQSLVELSKKEKKRRAKVTQKKIPVITNFDLIKKKRNPAVESLPNAEKIRPQTEPVTNIEDKETESAKSEAENAEQFDEAAVALLEENWNKSEEYASLLTLKIRELLQEFYSTGDTKLKDDIQRQMNEISQQLEKAKKDAEKAKEEYDLAKSTIKIKK